MCEFDTCGWSAEKQALHQLYALLITLAIAVLGGCVTGQMLLALQNSPTRMHVDKEHWAAE